MKKERRSVVWFSEEEIPEKEEREIMHNCNSHKNSTSKYKGVSWDKINKKWVSQICVNGKQKKIGRFYDEVMAAIAYNVAARKAFGVFARLNDVV